MSAPETRASPPLATPWVPLWPVAPSANAGLTKIADIIRPDSGPEIDITNIPQTFGGLRLYLWLRTDEAAPVSPNPFLRFNNDGGASYDWQQAHASGTTPGALEARNATGIKPGNWAGAQAPANTYGCTIIDIFNYASAHVKTTLAQSLVKSAETANGMVLAQIAGFWRSLAPITRMTLVATPLQWVAGSRATLYGLDPLTIQIPSINPSYGTTLPTSPIDGQEHILVDSVTAPTYQWRFRYNAGSSSPYKWEFVGGPEVSSYEATSVGTNGTDLGIGPIVTPPRSGVYLARHLSLHSVSCSWRWRNYNVANISGTRTMTFPPGLQFIEQQLTLAAGVQLHSSPSGGGGNSTERQTGIIPVRVA